MGTRGFRGAEVPYPQLAVQAGRNHTAMINPNLGFYFWIYIVYVLYVLKSTCNVLSGDMFALG